MKSTTWQERHCWPDSLHSTVESMHVYVFTLSKYAHQVYFQKIIQHNYSLHAYTWYSQSSGKFSFCRTQQRVSVMTELITTHAAVGICRVWLHHCIQSTNYGTHTYIVLHNRVGQYWFLSSRKYCWRNTCTFKFFWQRNYCYSRNINKLRYEVKIHTYIHTHIHTYIL